jgi:fatty acid desaturase
MNLPESTDYLKYHQSKIKQLLGTEKIRALHRKNPIIDFIAFPMLLTVFALLFALLNHFDFGVLWLVCFLAQGCLIQIMGLYAHEMCTHRKYGGRHYSHVCDLICSMLTIHSPTFYYVFHMRHHRNLNTCDDPEVKQLKLMIGGAGQTLGRKLLFSTILGAVVAEALSSKNPDAVVARKECTKEQLRAISLEKILIYLFIAATLGSLCFTKVMLWGYILPLAIVTPFMSTVRNVLEHMDMDASIPLQAATYYRSNVFTRLLFFYDSGDCHLVHHLFCMIPFYRMREATAAMRPYFLANGVREHRSMSALVWTFYAKGAPVRGSWANLLSSAKPSG